MWVLRAKNPGCLENMNGGNFMRRVFVNSIFGVSLVFSLSICYAQGGFEEKVRPPARAGQFYPGSREAVTQMIEDLLRNAEPDDVEGEIVGLWTPHAGYEFSGQVAANGYRLVQNRQYDVVVIIGPSHYMRLMGGSIGDWNAYRTPLGTVVVDTQIVREIRSSTSLVSCVPEAHRYEHSVEVQVPFVQSVLPGVPIVPMVIAGDLSYGDSEKIAEAIVEAVGDKKVLLVASSDMSHFPSYKDAYEVDLRVLDAVAEFDPKDLMRLNSSLMRKNIPNLDCVLCGQGALITVMLAAKGLQAGDVRILPYANSGDVTGERHRVVGYGAAVFYQEQRKSNRGGKGMLEEIPFSEEEKEKLFRIARKSIECALKREKLPEFSVKEPNLLVERGVFVTLENRGHLRGCIGHFEPNFPLFEIVSQMAIASATQDYRFAYNPVTVKEMDEIGIKISILSEMKKVDSIEEIEVGKHGIWIKQGTQSGTYLPEVATELGWNRIEFLEHCCAEKAGLPKNAWRKGAEIYIYSSQILDEKNL
jgi:AmmeMemoRadiSam system protein B/AmmeMemoRadiSam system protein A